MVDAIALDRGHGDRWGYCPCCLCACGHTYPDRHRNPCADLEANAHGDAVAHFYANPYCDGKADRDADFYSYGTYRNSYARPHCDTVGADPNALPHPT